MGERSVTHPHWLRMIDGDFRTDQLGTFAVELATSVFDLSLGTSVCGTAGDGLQLRLLQRALGDRSGLRQPLIAYQVALGKLQFAFRLSEFGGRQIDGSDRGADLRFYFVTRPQVEEWWVGRLDHRNYGLIFDYGIADIESGPQYTTSDRGGNGVHLFNARATFLLHQDFHRALGDRRNIDTDRFRTQRIEQRSDNTTVAKLTISVL